MQSFSPEKNLKPNQSSKDPVTKGFLFDSYKTCESFSRPAESHQSSRKQTSNAYREPAPPKGCFSKKSRSPNSPTEEALQKISMQDLPPFFPKKKRFEPSSKLHLLKATLPPLNPAMQSSLQTQGSSKEPSSSFPTKGKLESIESSTSNPLLKELDRQHQAFKLSVEAIRASLSES